MITYYGHPISTEEFDKWYELFIYDVQFAAGCYKQIYNEINDITEYKLQIDSYGKLFMLFVLYHNDKPKICNIRVDCSKFLYVEIEGVKYCITVEDDSYIDKIKLIFEASKYCLHPPINQKGTK